MAGYIGGLLEEVYGVAQHAEHIDIQPWLIAAAVVMGVVTSLIAAVIPARAAASVDPVKALQKGKFQSLSEGENRVRRRWAIVCAAASVLALALNRYTAIFYGGYLLAVLAMLLLTRIGLHSSYVTTILPALVILGLGMGQIMAPSMSVATVGLTSDAGIASAMLNTTQQVGGSIGTSLLNTLAASAATTYALANRATASQSLQCRPLTRGR